MRCARGKKESHEWLMDCGARAKVTSHHIWELHMHFPLDRHFLQIIFSPPFAAEVLDSSARIALAFVAPFRKLALAGHLDRPFPRPPPPPDPWTVRTTRPRRQTELHRTEARNRLPIIRVVEYTPLVKPREPLTPPHAQMSSSSPSDPLGVLRSHIEAAGVAVPDDGTLEALLAVEDGNALRAARLIIDDHRASTRRGGSGTASTSSALSAGTDSLRRRPAAAAGAGSGARYEAMGFAENEEQYEEAIGTMRRRARRPVGSNGTGSGRRGDDDNDGGGAFAADGIVGVLYQALGLPFSLLHSLILGLTRVLRFPAMLVGWFVGGGGGAGRGGNGAGGTRFEAEDGVNTAAKTFVDRLASQDGAPLPLTLLTSSYNDALKRTKTELKMLVVMLVDTSASDDEPSAFEKTLREEEVLQALGREEFLVWAASTRRKEGHLVARQLGARQFPFVGCVALRGGGSGRFASSSSSTSPQLSLISRMSGGAAMSSPAAIASHLASSYTRCSSFLEGLQAERIARETERDLMAEQDRAFEEVSRRDAERVAAKRAEEAARAQQEAQRQAEVEARRALQQKKMQWLQWARVNLRRRVGEQEEAKKGASPATTTAVHAVLPSGSRINKTFALDEPLEHLFAWIETTGGGSGGDEDEDSTADVKPPTDYDHMYNFDVFYGYPRQRLHYDAKESGHVTVGDVAGLAPRANIIVEGQLAAVGVSDGRGGGGGAEDSDSESSDSGEE